jgi:hypothetical protein
MKNNTLITVIVVLIVAAGAFFGGMRYQQSKALTNGGFGQGRGQFAGRFSGQRASGRPVNGEIVSQDANSVTVKMQDGSSKIINISGSTTYSKTDTASKSDLKTGQQIAAFGAENSDGSLTAQNIQLNPMFRFNQGSPRPSQ